METSEQWRFYYQQKCSQSSAQSTISTRMWKWTSAMPKIEQTDPNIKENRENEKLTVILSDERKSNDKDDSKFNSQRTTRKAAWEAKDRIFGQNLTDNWDTFGGGNVANMRELLFCLRNETLFEGYF